KVLKLLPFLAKRLIVQALVISQLDYGNALYLGSPQYVIKPLQITQNVAAQLLMDLPRHWSAKTALKDLQRLPVEQRMQLKALCIFHKSLHKRGPILLRSLATPYIPSRAPQIFPYAFNT
ncbi:hypothetical protein NDU88_001553, partial [Pleurodeles waltl]